MSAPDEQSNHKLILENQASILANQGTLQKNQVIIIANQETLKQNQATIIANQATIQNNQKGFDVVVKNQEAILSLLKK